MESEGWVGNGGIDEGLLAFIVSMESKRHINIRRVVALQAHDESVRIVSSLVWELFCIGVLELG